MLFTVWERVKWWRSLDLRLQASPNNEPLSPFSTFIYNSKKYDLSSDKIVGPLGAKMFCRTNFLSKKIADSPTKYDPEEPSIRAIKMLPSTSVESMSLLYSQSYYSLTLKSIIISGIIQFKTGARHHEVEYIIYVKECLISSSKQLRMLKIISMMRTDRSTWSHPSIFSRAP